jgi:hypothetical protein
LLGAIFSRFFEKKLGKKLPGCFASSTGKKRNPKGLPIPSFERGWHRL